MGSKDSKVYLGSPISVASAALEGKIVDPRKYLGGV
jgi:3-isopropylmalate/(R)-2-methylmalate dehydratase large subunit